MHYSIRNKPAKSEEDRGNLVLSVSEDALLEVIAALEGFIHRAVITDEMIEELKDGYQRVTGNDIDELLEFMLDEATEEEADIITGYIDSISTERMFDMLQRTARTELGSGYFQSTDGRVTITITD